LSFGFQIIGALDYKKSISHFFLNLSFEVKAAENELFFK